MTCVCARMHPTPVIQSRPPPCMAASHIHQLLLVFLLGPQATSPTDPGLHPVVPASRTPTCHPRRSAPLPAPHRGTASRWFRLWKNSTALNDPTVAPCVADQLSVVLDLVAADYRAYFALEFLNRSPVAWRRRHVKHFVMASTGAGGFVGSMRRFLATRDDDDSPLGCVGRSSAIKFTPLPSPKVFGPDTPLVVTPDKNYTAHDMPEFLTAVGLPAYEVTLYKTRALPVALSFGAPVVPTTEKLVYWDGNFGKNPHVVYGDGDRVVNSASILALDTMIGDDPKQEYYKSVKIASASHVGIVSDGAALRRVIAVILDHLSFKSARDFRGL